MGAKTICEGCGKLKAGGGHRFCRACICDLLDGQPLGTTERRNREERNRKRKIRTMKQLLQQITTA